MTDIRTVVAEFTRAHDSIKKPIPFIAIVPPDSVPPDEATRKAMSRARDQVLDRCISMHLVLEGEGFRLAILRNALAAMLLFGDKLFNDKLDKVFLHRTLKEALDVALRQAPVDVKFDKIAILEQALATGVASPAPSKDLKGIPGTR